MTLRIVKSARMSRGDTKKGRGEKGKRGKGEEGKEQGERAKGRGGAWERETGDVRSRVLRGSTGSPSRALSREGSRATEEATAAYMGTYVRIAEEGVRSRWCAIDGRPLTLEEVEDCPDPSTRFTCSGQAAVNYFFNAFTEPTHYPISRVFSA